MLVEQLALPQVGVLLVEEQPEEVQHSAHFRPLCLLQQFKSVVAEPVETPVERHLVLGMEQEEMPPQTVVAAVVRVE